ncbi:Transcription elongation factor, GreA/GreB family [Rubritalea squalenifaciens DSM 18772]|uniref:Transcription elongation factor, GreA/GreB family n=1 Tax=Rubritalea squalenifaciens DSM 18772 TaxID=1123071 RepID=A0A1M6MIJ2_9BACT|nr:GreA/GreB family elongation factor [Rubritalea squalenifaciens]SHJ83236.1 Transcription elongation factor, GreA/GreB family [Rubritalea squalenifaciens DSM 18772]
MHPEVAKLVEAGRISEEVGTRLSEIAPGKFCLHKNWGAGKVKDWDLRSGKIVIDFETNEDQEMALQFAIQKTEYLEEDDFRAQKLESMGELRRLADQDPVELVKRTLQSQGGSMKLDQLERELMGSVIPEKDYKKWWESAKKALRASRVAVVPTKRTEPLVLRDENLSPAESLVMDFENARDFKAKARALEAIIKDFKYFKGDADAQSRINKNIDEAVRKGMKMHLGQSLDLLVGRDELMELSEVMDLDASAIRISDIIATEGTRVGEELGSLPAARQRMVFEAYPAAFGDSWVEELLNIFDNVGPRGLAEIAKLLIEKGESEKLFAFLRKHIVGRTLGADSLLWVCREREKSSEPVFDFEVGNAILSLLERDSMDDGPRKSSRLQSYVMEDRGLIGDLLKSADNNETRNFARKLHQSQIFAELDRKSLMARVIKAKPETQDLVTGEGSEKKEEGVVSSWDSIEKRKADLADLKNNQIPQNREDIKIARSYGDLRENAEYHMAKDHQKVLMRRQSEMERALDTVQGTDFSNVDTSEVNIGTIAHLEDEKGNKITITILGAWDSIPEENVISYLSEMGNSLLGLKVGDTVDIKSQTMTVKEVEAYNKG